MYVDWILVIGVILIVCLLYAIYVLVEPQLTPEGFVPVQTPNQEYTIPDLKGVTGRYVRIRPSLDPNADGYLTISQIQVLDINGENVAIQMPVTATSWGGSPIDQKYGKTTLAGNFYTFSFGKSNVPSSIVDGTLSPRISLENVFETSIQNTAANDTQYIEIDLGENTIISSIIYTGRGDAQTRSIEQIDGTIDNLTQVNRIKGMRVEIRDESKALVFGSTNNIFPTTDTVQRMNINSDLYTINPGKGSANIQTISVPDVDSYKAFLKPYITAFNTKGYIEGDLKNLVDTLRATYNASVNIDISNNIFIPALFDSPVTFYHDFYTKGGCPITSCGSITNPTLLAKCNTQLKYCSIVSRQPAVTNKSIQIFGSASATALQEMNQSIEYCKSLYLGNPASIENYIRLHFSLTNLNLILPYLRGSPPSSGTSSTASNPPQFCVPDIAQIFRRGNFVTSFIAQNQSANMTNCTIQLTGTVLGLIPFASRNMIVHWVYNRTLRYKRFINTLRKNLDLAVADRQNAFNQWAAATRNVETAGDPKNFTPMEIGLAVSFFGLSLAAVSIAKTVIATVARDNAAASYNAANALVTEIQQSVSTPGSITDVPETATRLQVPSYINISSTSILDSIAQQFYELLGGQYTISYIYDLLPLGSTMLDMRFDLLIHNSATASYGPINDLKAQYSRIRSATTQSQDVLNQAAVDYQTTLASLENNAVQGVANPFKGAVARFFYTVLNNVVTITGVILDDNAVTSFIPELNGGIPVPLGPTPGNINYKPKVLFTKNQIEPLDCTNSQTLRRIFDDYIDLVSDRANKYPLSTATPPLDLKEGTLYVNSVLGATQLTPTSCNLTWTETLYDSNTNMPVNSGSSGSRQSTVTRSARFTYTADLSSWYSQELTLTMSGITFLTSSTGITPLTPPVVFTKPLPVKSTLDNMSDICPVATCEDADVLFSIVDQYNSDPTLLGTILSVTHAFTPNPNQCDLKVSINYDSKIQNILGKKVTDPVTGITKIKYNTLNKGAVTYDRVDGVLVEGSKQVPDACIITPSSPACLSQKTTTTRSFNAQTATLSTPVNVRANTSFTVTAVGNGLLPTSTTHKPLWSIYPANIVVGTSCHGAESHSPHNNGQCYTCGDVFLAYQAKNWTTNWASNLPNMGQCISSVISGGSIPTTNTFTAPSTPGTYTISLRDLNEVITANITVLPASSAVSNVMQDITIAMYVALDKVACSYVLLDASGQNSGTSIQPNTPALYTPMIYANELAKQTTAALGSSVPSLQRNYATAVGSSSNTLRSYRSQSYNAFNSIKAAHPSVSLPTDADFTAIKSEIDAKVPTISAFTDYAPTRRVDPEAIRIRGFGLDGIRNYDAGIKDTQFTLPLDQQEERKPRHTPPSYRFLRFTPTATRGDSIVNVGKFTFFYEEKPLLVKGSVSNPMGTWEGSMTDVTGPSPGPGWSDTHKKPLVFAFRDPIAIDAYSFTTALSDADIEGDPISWKLEGSSNGTFWTVVDTQKNYPTPVTRFTELEKIYLI